MDNIVDIKCAKEKIGDKLCIMGNVSPTEVVMCGNRDRIFSEVLKCINKAYNNPKGFILSTGCQIPINTPMENIDYFMDAARRFGRVR